ncbi:MAG: hypothetical protein A2X82_06945 [Geobacteraceae bacterium GWC2_55_20]|nr:MAG: hypothetical protein A2X82_06945 [Geobacteraceae bacterium GWC2_55_20]HCE68367.1 hypothetical protein [Geobacter sp.]
MLPLLEAEAKERQRLAGASHTGNQHTGITKLEVVQLVAQPPEPSPRSIEAAAKAVGVNKKYVADMKTIARVAPMLAATPLSTFDRAGSGLPAL